MLMNRYFKVTWNAPLNIKALITTRHAYHANSNYNDFNLAYHVDDDKDKVTRNRELLNSDLPALPYWLNQTHSDLALDLDNIPQDLAIPNYDAAYTHEANKVCVVMTADCLPILLTDKHSSFVAAIHAGWRGLHNNIISKTIKACTNKYEDIIAYIGPAICSKHYQVGLDVVDLFKQADIKYLNFFKPHIAAKFDCDLLAIAAYQLKNLNIPQSQIFFSNKCTYCHNNMFYSYRKDNKTGRFASLIWLTS